MKSLMTKLQETSEKQAHAGVIKAVKSPKSTDDSLVVGDTQVGESWLHCQVCNHKCGTMKSMKNHQNTKHKNIKFCEKCSEGFLSKEAFETHVINMHKAQQTEQTSECDQSKVCEICSYTYKTNGDRQYHMLIEHKFEICGECGKLFSNRDLINKHMELKHNSEDLNVSLDEGRQ